MAIGFSPNYQEAFPLDGLSSQQFLVIALEAVSKLNWNVGYTSATDFVAYTKISMSSWGEEIKISIDGDKATLKSECRGSQFMDWGKNKRNITDFILVFNQQKASIPWDELSLKAEQLIQHQALQLENLVDQPAATTKANISDFISIFKPAEGYFITPILININIAIFILMVVTGVNPFMPDTESLLKWGANFKSLTLQGEWWRLISCCFIHIGILHLLMNMYALVYIGALLETHLGKARFVAAYLLTGLTGSMASLYWHDFTISAGASGAIFGMYGVFLAMLTTNLIEKSARTTMLTSIAFFVGYNLLNGLRGGIDNAGHIRGLLGGLLIGYAYYPSLVKSKEIKLKYQTIGLLTLSILFSSFLIYRNLPNNVAEYEKKMEQFVSMESMALELYNMPGNIAKEQLLTEIKDRGIYYWKENIKLLNSLDRLNLSDGIHERNNKLKQYCKLRIKSYELFYKQVAEESMQYKEQIESTDKQIQALIDELNGKSTNE